ncbi:PREDICTED: uncharacterized protein LOC105360568 [Ceratosolen solmsi marchali]|uniref:Uncharacterized protein LOC105360568 n=1 Tax=Ceratosolen solmsi marchali TaxID=326594 RepID=A0AAJ7DSV2_9HYME|nr:PREDICTED: uncharacterized protein LOC105360568 [Ceratosolen solmsi marchali]XP_011495810.1 PREDICTED: uncharacterized protein LOC105360568 [Ceratosolen solmsi marchali]
MANPGTVIAHIVKLIVTITCMKFFKDSFTLRAAEQGWAVRAFQILLVHSILGIFRFGGPGITKRFRNFYELFSSVIEVVPFAFFTTEVLLKYCVREEFRFLLLAFGLLPTVIELSSTRIKDRSKLQNFTNFVLFLQMISLILVCLFNDNYGGLSLGASLAVARYISEDFCDHYEVPYVDLSQYSLSFVEIFALASLKEA